MKGRLHKLPGGWEVLYTECVPKMMVREWNRSIALHPKDVEVQKMMGWDGKDVEFEIIDCSQMCKQCGEVVERGRNCSKGCFMKSGNFILTDKLEYAKLIKSQVKSENKITDDEIIKEAIEHSKLYTNKFVPRNAFIMGARWFRDKLNNN
jgi:hypothetical protein